jgi:hypothetical protein
MSKVIKPTESDIEKLKEDFMKALLSGKWENGKVNFQATLGKVDRKATVFFNEIAWRKMQALVKEFSSEIGWHGIAYRGEDETKDEYYITDIIVYPQEVTGATVTTDQVEYQDWLMNHDDEVFNNIRMQGHSHVNMSTTPSSVDWALYKSILDQLDDDMFYIFLIWNKSGSKTILIYDMKKNILFETADVTVEVEDDGGFDEFMEEAKKLVKTKTVSTTYTKQETKKDTKKETKKDSKGSATQSYTGYSYGQWDSDWDDEYTYYGYGKRYNYGWRE